MRLSRRSSRENFAIDLTTCSDIIFTLLIFYILTQSFVTQVPLNLPKLKSEAQSLTVLPDQIEISRSGQVSWNKTPMGIDWEQNLHDKLGTLASDSTVLILTHKQAPAGIAIELLDRLRLAGVSDVSFGGLPYKDEADAGTIK